MEHSRKPQNLQISMIPSQPLWTFEENKFFENVLAEVDHTSPSLYEDIARRMPWKSTNEIQEHYQQLIQDLNSIDLGDYPQPIYNHRGGEEEQDLEIIQAYESPSRRKKYTRKNNYTSTQWTQQEHQLFLMGLKQYGKGDWKSISMHCVRTKTSMQVASHAQKYFKRLNNPTPANRRRYSIHDSRMDPNLFPPADDDQSQMHKDASLPAPNSISNPSEFPPNPNPNCSKTVEGLVADLPLESNVVSTINDADTSQPVTEFGSPNEPPFSCEWLESILMVFDESELFP